MQNGFQKFSPTTLADLLPRTQVMAVAIRPLWEGMPRIAGPAFTVRCPHGDNLMMHAAIYRAPPGSIIVVESADSLFAVAGGNVCKVAQNRGIAGFVIDGVIRDLEELRNNSFPVFACGVIPIPGGKEHLDILNGPIVCGGVQVMPGDTVVADEEGIVVVPQSQTGDILEKAEARVAKEDAETLEQWERAHHARIEEILKKNGFTG